MGAETKTRREKVEDRESAILAAARDVFIEAGFEGARVAEIGRRAGIAEGTVYLYYRNKSALMEGVLAMFWEDLTDGARAAVAGAETPDAQLRRLAEFHLDRLIADYAFLDLAARLRQWSGRDPGLRAHMRNYVAVFDEIFNRCQDRGLARVPGPVWIARDAFFGTLDYSARTILQGQARETGPVVDHLIALMLVDEGHRAGDFEPVAGRPRVDKL